MLLEGIFVPLTTPFHPDGRLFLHKLELNVERYSLTPAAGMLVLGRQGEGDALTDVETAQVLKTAIAAAADEKVMIAHVGRESVRRTLELAELAAMAGYDAAVVRAPEFARDPAMQRELAVYFQAVADGAALPVIVESDSERPVRVELMAELANHPGIIGALDSELSTDRLKALLAGTAGVMREVTVTAVFAAATGRMLRQTEAGGNFVSAESLGGGAAIAVAPPKPRMKTRTRRVGFQVLEGSTGGMLEAWQAGAAGAVPPLGAAAPQACCEVWQAFKDGDPGLAAEKQERVRAAGDLVRGSRGIAPLKHGCDLNGYFGGRPRLPLLPLTAEKKDALEKALAGLKN